MRANVLSDIIKRATAIALSLMLCVFLSPFAFAEVTSAADTVTETPTEDSTTASTDDHAAPESDRVIHVMAGGESDGSDNAHPMGDIALAIESLSETGGRIIVYGKYELSSSSRHSSMLGAFDEPAHRGAITISGSDGYLVCPENYRYYMSGDTTFENITISGSGALVVAARYNRLVMGERISIIGISDGVTLIGGYNGSSGGMNEEMLTRDTYVDVYSGSYKYVCGYNRMTSKKTASGVAYINIRGGEVNCVAAGVSGYNTAFSENVMSEMRVSVSGGKVYKLSDVDMAAYGTLSRLSLEYTGGAIENIIIGDAVASSISFTDEMVEVVKGILRHFDTYRQGSGEHIKTERIKIAFAGDSITGGMGTTDPARDSYPAQLSEMLGGAYEVGNFSEGGRCVLSDSGSPYFESEAFADSLLFMPDVVCIMLGTNDLSSLIGRDDAAEVLRRDMLTLLEKYTALDSKPIIYLLTPTARTDDNALEEGIRDIILPTYKKISEDLGLGFVDTYTVSQDMKHHLTDSVHPDSIACSYIATWLYNAIVSNSNISSTVTDVSRVEVVVKREEAETTAPPEEAEGGSAVWLAVCVAGGAALMLGLAVIKHINDEKESGVHSKENADS